MISQTITKQELFDMGRKLSIAFLRRNFLPTPQYLTYEHVFANFHPDSWEHRFLTKCQNGPKQGYATGIYKMNRCFVNLKKASRAVMHPGCSSWSFPCYKIDREPCGVVAHETGHHANAYTHDLASSDLWAQTVRHSKPITSYEPNLDESMAETFRLFILNPDLLLRGSTPRYDFLIAAGLHPSETRDFRQVLDHPTYIAQAERWIAKQK